MDATCGEMGAHSLLSDTLKDAAFTRPRGILTDGTTLHSHLSPEALHEPALDIQGAENGFCATGGSSSCSGKETLDSSHDY